MRYTTIIDISDIPPVYRNNNARLVYLHMVCKSGYHDNDRDLIDTSIRRLSYQTSLTVAAVRHALRILSENHLIERQGDFWFVRKFIIEQPISRRASTRKQQQQTDEAKRRNEANRLRDAEMTRQRQQREQLQAEGKTSFIVYYESQLEKAKQGDEEAKKIVERHRTVYDSQKRQMQKNK